jgi:hypothetical protein
MNDAAKGDRMRVSLDDFFQLAADGNQRLREQGHTEWPCCPRNAGETLRSLNPSLPVNRSAWAPDRILTPKATYRRIKGNVDDLRLVTVMPEICRHARP